MKRFIVKGKKNEVLRRRMIGKFTKGKRLKCLYKRKVKRSRNNIRGRDRKMNY